MNEDYHPIINDINQCLEQAQYIAKRFEDKNQDDRGLLQIFTSLAGDEIVGLLAYVIWRGRSRLLSSLRSAPSISYDDATRVRHAQT
jgi:hypothetical protein